VLDATKSTNVGDIGCWRSSDGHGDKEEEEEIRIMKLEREGGCSHLYMGKGLGMRSSLAEPYSLIRCPKRLCRAGGGRGRFGGDG